MGKRASRNDGMPARIAPPLCFGVFPVSHDLADDFWAFLRENCPSRKISARVYVKTATVVMANVFPSLRTPQGLYDTCQFIDLVELSSMWIYDTW